MSQKINIEKCKQCGKKDIKYIKGLCRNCYNKELGLIKKQLSIEKNIKCQECGGCLDGTFKNLCKKCYFKLYAIKNKIEISKKRKEHDSSPEHKKKKSQYDKKYRKINEKHLKELRILYVNNNKKEIKQYQDMYINKNKEKLKEKKKQYYLDNCEELKEKSKQYYRDNLEIIKPKMKKYRIEQNKKPEVLEKERKRSREYGKTHSAQHAKRNDRYRKHIRIINDINKIELLEKYDYECPFKCVCGNKCIYEKLKNDKTTHISHLHSVARHTKLDKKCPHSWDNVVPMRDVCNISMGDKTPLEFIWSKINE
jgi:hypothetical protein